MTEADRLANFAALQQKLLWLSTWMIHNANHLRETGDGLNVGGHQASSASLATIMTALYFADRLNAGWTAAQRAREAGLVNARSHIERLLGDVPPHCALITVIDGHPATLAWLGAVRGHRTRPLGVEHFGQSGSITELYRHFGIDAKGIVRAAEATSEGRRIRQLRLYGEGRPA